MTKPVNGPTTLVVETYRPNQASTNHAEDARTRVRVHRRESFSMDDTNPSLTSLWEVAGVATQSEAFAHIIEVAAGVHRENVRNLIGHAPTVAALPPVE